VKAGISGITLQETLRGKPQIKKGAKAMAEILTEGELAPDFQLPSNQGKDVRLTDMRGKKVVLYFYPKDNTSG
jgi:peroxiredoxin